MKFFWALGAEGYNAWLGSFDQKTNITVTWTSVLQITAHIYFLQKHTRTQAAFVYTLRYALPDREDRAETPKWLVHWNGSECLHQIWPEEISCTQSNKELARYLATSHCLGRMHSKHQIYTADKFNTLITALFYLSNMESIKKKDGKMKAMEVLQSPIDMFMRM